MSKLHHLHYFQSNDKPQAVEDDATMALTPSQKALKKKKKKDTFLRKMSASLCNK